MKVGQRTVQMPFPGGSWIRTWASTATVGTAVLVSWFVVYEVIERAYLRERLSIDALFALHIWRGAVAAIILGSWSYINVWRLRRRYDAVFEEAHGRLQVEMEERTRDLAHAHVFTERLFDALRDGVTVLDRSGRVVRANRIAATIGGDGFMEGQGCVLFPDTCTFGARRDCSAHEAFLTGEPVLGRIRSDPRTGRVYSIDAYPAPGLDEGEPVVIESARDITEERRLEAHIRSQDKLAALGVLAAGVAHDIGNPLASMSSELEMLESEEDVPTIRASVALVRREIARIARTLREMTDFARRRGEEVGDVDVAVAIGDALRMVRHHPRARRVRIVEETEPDLPHLRMVEDHLVSSLVNLMMNGFDAMPQGGTMVLRVRAAGGERGREVQIEVIDTGTGMPEAVRARATELFFTTKDRGHGTGLGLALCNEMASDVGGKLEIESTEGEGTVVRLRIPAERGRDG